MCHENHVFHSEKRLYSSDTTFNHRLRPQTKIIEPVLFSQDSWDLDVMYPLVVSGAKSMESKLSLYAHSQLPGGIYWNAEPAVQKILSELEPSNDLCESILGLN